VAPQPSRQASAPERMLGGFALRKQESLLFWRRTEINWRKLELLRNIDPDLVQINVQGLVQQGSDVTGKAITSTTMISCSPIQGRAPQ